MTSFGFGGPGNATHTSLKREWFGLSAFVPSKGRVVDHQVRAPARIDFQATMSDLILIGDWYNINIYIYIYIYIYI